MKALIPIDVIANDICGDIGDSVLKHKFKLTRHLLDGYRDMHMFVSQDFDVKTAILKFDNNINMPCDFVYETKVGVLHKGCLAVLTLDRNIRPHRLTDTQCTDYLNDIWNGAYSGDGYWFYNAYRGNGFVGELYGMGRGVYNEGTYNIDKKNGTIQIGSHIPKDAEIVIEYKSDGVSSGLKLVPVEMKKCLEFYAKAQFYADRNITQSQINQNKYEAAYNKVKRLYNFQNALYISAKTNEMFSPTNY